MEEVNSLNSPPDWNWNRPQNVMANIRKQKVKKRALQSRLSLESESPTKKPRRYNKKFSQSELSRPSQPPPDEQTNEDSTLMELLCMDKPTPDHLNPNNYSSHSLSSNSVSSTSVINFNKEIDVSSSPLRTYLPSYYANLEKTPTTIKKRRQLIPTPVSTSPSKSSAFARRHKENGSSSTTTTNRVNNVNNINSDDDNYWSEELCQDWSIKTGIRIVTCKPFGWTSNHLKLLEQSSGTTAFVRCIDRDPATSNLNTSPSNYQLDGLQFIGAQFQQCCLYWQFPVLYETSLFPRTGNIAPTNFVHQSHGEATSTIIRFNEKRSDHMYLEWVESFKSAFQLIRARQCPYFYMSTNQFTCLFTAAGMQANEDIQVAVSPASKGFRDVLTAEGIDFSMPYVDPEDIDPKVTNGKNTSGNDEKSKAKNNDDEDQKDDKEIDDADDSDEEKWLDELGVSQSLSFSSAKSKANAAVKSKREKNKSSLLVIVGSKDVLTFFNFLLNSKKHVISNTGHLSGVPPTIISPVAFIGASLQTLKTKQSKVPDGKGGLIHAIDINGPVMPHVVHMFSTLLMKTAEDFKIQMTTMAGSTFFNFLARKEKPKEKSRPSAFHLQSLTDCGLGKTILEIFCRDDNVDSIKTVMECKTGLFQWT